MGNPGQQYLRTRHNLGFWALNLAAERLEASWTKVHCKASVARADHGPWKLIFAKPVTFMNLSGDSVRCFFQSDRFNPEELLVACDDVNLPLGQIRIRKEGSAGGHHGLESIIQAIGSQQFPRIRIGVKPLDENLPLDLAEFVLEQFRKGEEAIAAQSVRNAVEAIFVILDENIEAAMNKYNRR